MCEGIVANDLVWTNIDIVMNETSLKQKTFATVGPIFISCLVIFSLLSLESLVLNFSPSISPVILYFTTTASVVYCILGIPWLTFKYLETEKFYLKSIREKVFMYRLVLQLIFVLIVVPTLYNYILVTYSPYGFRELVEPHLNSSTDILIASAGKQLPSVTRTSKQQSTVDTLAYSNEYFLRYMTQVVFVIICLHWYCDSETILKAFLSMLKMPGKYKFKHFLYDLELRNALAVAFYTLCLFLSLIVPISTVLTTIFFTLAVSSIQCLTPLLVSAG